MLSKFSKLIMAIACLMGVLIWSSAATTFAANSIGLDEGLEAAIRAQIALNDEKPVTKDEVSILTSLYIGQQNNIRSLEGLQNAVFLEQIIIDGNVKFDLSSLSKLPSLSTLEIQEDTLEKAAKMVIAELREKGVTVINHAKQQVNTQPIQVFIDGEPIAFTKDPILKSGTTMVQFRPLFESFGLEVGWDNATRTVTGMKEKLHIELVIGSKNALVNNKQLTLPSAPTLIDGNTMVPLRFIGEATGRRVLWDGETRTININSSAASYLLNILYSNDTVYEGQTSNGVPNGTGKFLYNGSLLYEGQVKDGIITGHGKMYDIMSPVSYYEGDFLNNRFDGEGKTIYNDESYHIGSYRNGMRDGKGTLHNSDGALLYEGMFKEEALHGEGTGYYGEVKYVGTYAIGSFHGQGKLYYQDTLDYDGTWEYGRRSRGNAYSEGKLHYEGTYTNDKPEGYGAFYSDNGKITYRGQVRSNNKIGVGIIYYENGDRYVGEIYYGLADGKGILSDTNGAIKHDGYFKDGDIDSDPAATASSTDAFRKLIISNASHSVIDGYYRNDTGLTPDQAIMFITLESADHVELFNNMSKADKVRLINEYTQNNWGDVLGVEECFTYIVYDINAYAEANIGYEMQDEDVELILYPKGQQIFE